MKTEVYLMWSPSEERYTKGIRLLFDSTRFKWYPEFGSDGLSGTGFYWLGFYFDVWYISRMKD